MCCTNALACFCMLALACLHCRIWALRAWVRDRARRERGSPLSCDPEAPAACSSSPATACCQHCGQASSVVHACEKYVLPPCAQECACGQRSLWQQMRRVYGKTSTVYTASRKYAASQHTACAHALGCLLLPSGALAVSLAHPVEEGLTLCAGAAEMTTCRLLAPSLARPPDVYLGVIGAFG